MPPPNNNIPPTNFPDISQQYGQNTMLRSAFDQFMATPNAASQQLVNDALRAQGLDPMFSGESFSQHMTGAQIPPRFDLPTRGGAIDFARMQHMRMSQVEAVGKPFDYGAAQHMRLSQFGPVGNPAPYDFNALRNTPLSQFGPVGRNAIPAPVYTPPPPPIFTPMAPMGLGGPSPGVPAAGYASLVGGVYPQNISASPTGGFTQEYAASEVKRLLKDISETSHSIDRTDKRILYLDETSYGFGGGKARNLLAEAAKAGPQPQNDFLGIINQYKRPVDDGLSIPRPMAWMATGGPAPFALAGGGRGGSGGGGGGRGAPPAPPPWEPGEDAMPGMFEIGGLSALYGMGRFARFSRGVGGLVGGRLGAGIGLAAGLGAEAAWKTARIPLGVGRFAEGLFNESRPYTDFNVGLSNALRGSGTDFRSASDALIPPWGADAPDWMASAGITPMRALESIQRFGGLRPGMNLRGFVEGMRNMRLSTAYSNLPEGTSEGLAMLGSRYGISSGSDANLLPTQFASALQEAFSLSLDQAEVLRSIRVATEDTAKSAAFAPDTGAIGRMFSQMLQVDMPGARSGQSERNIASGMANAMGSPFDNPMRTVMVDQLRRSINWRDPQSVNRVLGEGAFQKLQGSEYGRAAIGAMQENLPGMQPFLDKTMGELMAGSPTTALSAANQLISGMYPNMPTGSRQMLLYKTLGGAMGIDEKDIAAFLESQNKAIPKADTGPTGRPEAEFRAEVEGQLDAFRGMRSHFKIFGDNLEIINKEFGPYIQDIGDASAALVKLARSADAAAGGGATGAGGEIPAGQGGLLGAAGSAWSRWGSLLMPQFGLGGGSLYHGGSIADADRDARLQQNPPGSAPTTWAGRALNWGRGLLGLPPIGGGAGGGSGNLSHSIVRSRHSGGAGVTSPRADAFTAPSGDDISVIRQTVAAAGGNEQTQAAFLAMFSPEDPGLNPSGVEGIRGSGGVGGRGGASWAQWTASRRRQLEQFGWTGTDAVKDREASAKMLHWELTTNPQFAKMVRDMNASGDSTAAAIIGGRVFEQGGAAARLFGYTGDMTQQKLDRFHSHLAPGWSDYIKSHPEGGGAWNSMDTYNAFHHGPHGSVIPPWVSINSKGQPYELNMTAAERVKMQSTFANKRFFGDYHPDLTGVDTTGASFTHSLSPHSVADKHESGGAVIQTTEAFHALAHILKEVTDHLHNMGQAAKNAGSGMSKANAAAGPNTGTSPKPKLMAQNYP